MNAQHKLRALLALFLAATTAGAAPRGDGLGTEQRLRVRGREFVNERGGIVRLRGVNIGGWLVTEGWMCGQTDRKDRWALEQLEERFGVERADALMNDWRDHWFVERDLDTIRSWGFNVIRVPFGYRNLQDAAGGWRRNERGGIDFSRLDWVVREAGRREIYVILDLHIWRGQRDDYHRISRDDPAGEADRAHAAALWREVARHFKDEPAIAGFDAINEPDGSPGNRLQRAMYEAIRSQDAARVVILESLDMGDLAGPSWENVAWSGHYPTTDNDPPGTIEERVAAWARGNNLDREGANVPVFVGEMKSPADDAASARALVEAVEARGWSWAVWTYRGVSVGGWAAFNHHDTMRVDLSADSLARLRDAWTRGLRAGSTGQARGAATWNAWWIDGFRVRADRRN